MDQERVLVMMIGLPCTGKSYLVNKLVELMRSRGVTC